MLVLKTYILTAEHIKTTNVRLDSSIIKKLSLDLGFDDCGISCANVFSGYYDFFEKWLADNNYAGMSYLKRYQELRKDPQFLLENAKSVISVILNYYSDEHLVNKDFSISKYAYGTDYHKVLKEKLSLLLQKIKSLDPEINGRFFVDTAPVFERYFAERSGLGVIGKNNCLIHKKFGSWIFIGEIILDVELKYDNPVTDDFICENCNICIESCPTGALSDKNLDANKCISYHTIENKGQIPDNIKKYITTQVFGCDICQSVCPCNRNPVTHNHDKLKILPQIRNISYNQLKQMNSYEFKMNFYETSLFRSGREKLVNNYEAVIQNKKL
ncbi:MAG: tRNA epoxyqueuosine(34) reductase QueG [Bacteroidales bacterium]|nr:tRNA epoxyqueuosine(34) reductase QueG [Bacteroidales bacterium]